MRTKNKVQNYLKLGVLLSTTLFTFMSCIDEIDHKKEIFPEFFSSKITLNDLKTKSKKTIISLNKLTETSTSKSGISSNNTYQIDSTNIISLSDQNGFTSYTFRVITALNEPILQNIIISHYDTGNSSIVLIEYDLDKNIGNIYGNIDNNILSAKYYDLNDPILVNAKGSDLNCVTSATGEWRCNQGGQHDRGTSRDICGGTSFAFTFRYTYGPCTNTQEFVLVNGTGGNGNFSLPGNGGSSGYYYDSIPPNITISTPTAPNMYMLTFLRGNNYDLNSPEIDWVENNPILANTFGQAITTFPNNPETAIDILHYLMLNDTLPYGGINFQEIFDFVEENNDTQLGLNLINDFLDDTETDYPGNNIGYPYKWWKDDNFILNSGNFDMPSDSPNQPDEQKPNIKEMALFALLRSQAILHIQNSVTASDKAIELAQNNTFSQTSYKALNNGKADAFRHSFWNALGTAEFGSEVMRIFSDAHEWNQSGLDVLMDLNNNSVGINISLNNNFGFTTSNTIIANTIQQSVLNGNMQYLYPTGSNGGIIFGVSQRILTNQ